MKILLTPSDLSAACTLAASIVGKAETPERAALVIDATHEQVRVIAVSGDAGVGVVIDLAATVQEDGVVAVNAADLLRTAKALPSEVATVRLDGAVLVLLSGFLTFRLPTVQPETIARPPVVETEAEFAIVAADLRRLIDQTLFCVAGDDNRYGLNGAHVEEVDEGVVRFVATDGNRLAWSEAPHTGTVGVDARALLPRRALAELRKVINDVEGDVVIATSPRAVRVSVPRVALFVRLLEAEFPDYRQVLPTTFARRLLVDRDTLLDAVKRVAVCARDTSKTMVLVIAEDGVRLSARTSDHGEGTGEVPCELNGEPITLGVNAGFLADALAAARGDRVAITFNDALGAVVIRSTKDEDALFVVMPLRVDA